MGESFREWLDRNPRFREFGGLFLLLVGVGGSFYLGLSLRTVDSYVCFSYVGVDPIKGWVYPGKFVPDCRPAPNNDSLVCPPGTELYKKEFGLYSGDDLPNLTNGAGNT